MPAGADAEVYTNVVIGFTAPTLPVRGKWPKNCRFPETLAQRAPAFAGRAPRHRMGCKFYTFSKTGIVAVRIETPP
jgi:hypothetical protein